MAEEAPKKMGWFSKIKSRDDAIMIAKDSGMGFFVIAGIQAAMGAWIAPTLLIDAAIFAICGFFVRRSFSRTAAVIALLMSLIDVVGTVMSKIGESVGLGNNFLLVLLVLSAVRSVDATFKLHGRFKEIADVEKQRETPT